TVSGLCFSRGGGRARGGRRIRSQSGESPRRDLGRAARNLQQGTITARPGPVTGVPARRVSWRLPGNEQEPQAPKSFLGGRERASPQGGALFSLPLSSQEPLPPLRGKAGMGGDAAPGLSTIASARRRACRP